MANIDVWNRGRFPRSFSDMFREFDEAFEQMRRPYLGSQLAGGTSQFQPAVDIDESEDAYLISVDLPGIKKEDIQIDLNDRLLTISGERKYEQESGRGRSRQLERGYGMFQRSFSLPHATESDRVEAHFEDGVLEVMIPKSEESRAKRIEIQSGKSGFASRLLGKKDEQEKTSRH